MRPWWLRLLAYARPQWRGIALTSGCLLLSIGMDALRPWPMKWIIDHLLAGRPLPPAAAWIAHFPGGATPSGQLAWLAVLTVAVYLAAQILRITQGYVQAGAGLRMVYDFGAQLFDHLQRLSLTFHGRHRVGDLIRRVTADTVCVRDLVLWVLLLAVSSFASLLTMFVIMWRLDASLAVLAICAAPLLGLIMRACSGRMSDLSLRQQQQDGNLMAHAERALTAIPILQAFSRENFEARMFRRLSRRSIRAYVNTIDAQLRFKLATGAVIAAGAAVVMVVGGLHVVSGSLTVGGLWVFITYLGALYAPMETMAYLATGYASAKASAQRVFEVLDSRESVHEAPDAIPFPFTAVGGRGHVRFEDVTFGYDTARPVLCGITLEARPGETVALVGPTGAGKSTLVSLLLRFYDPQAGAIICDGVDLRRLRLASLRDSISIVMQDPFLFPLSVAENIAYGRPDAGFDAIVQAARDANADAFIRELPKGYDTLLGERGATLSGGQRQRLAIARALLKNAPVLILDEPTAALDAVTEAAVMEAVTRLTQNRTTFIIAHRLTTVQRADRILVLDEGRIVEVGTHQDLIAAGGLYASQSQAMR